MKQAPFCLDSPDKTTRPGLSWFHPHTPTVWHRGPIDLTGPCAAQMAHSDWSQRLPRSTGDMRPGCAPRESSVCPYIGLGASRCAVMVSLGLVGNWFSPGRAS